MPECCEANFLPNHQLSLDMVLELVSGKSIRAFQWGLLLIAGGAMLGICRGRFTPYLHCMRSITRTINLFDPTHLPTL